MDLFPIYLTQNHYFCFYFFTLAFYFVPSLDNTSGCVKLKTVTDIRRSRARNSFFAESVYLVLNSLWDWEPVERLK